MTATGGRRRRIGRGARAGGVALSALLGACTEGPVDPIPDFDPLSRAYYEKYTGPEAAAGAAAGAADAPVPGPAVGQARRPAPRGFAGIRRDPSVSSLERGLAFLSAGEPDLAHKAFMRSLRLEPHKAAALTGAGIAAERRGLLTRARDYFEAARAMAPTSDVAHNNLGAVLYTLGDYGAAHQAFQSAYALSSGRNDVARVNLERTRQAMRREFPEPEPVRAKTLERIGRNEYRLLATGEAETALQPDDPTRTPAAVPPVEPPAATEAGTAAGEERQAGAEAGAAVAAETAAAEAAGTAADAVAIPDTAAGANAEDGTETAAAGPAAPVDPAPALAAMPEPGPEPDPAPVAQAEPDSAPAGEPVAEPDPAAAVRVRTADVSPTPEDDTPLQVPARAVPLDPDIPDHGDPQ